MARVYKCKTSFCRVYLPEAGYCSKHKKLKAEEKKIKDSWYDKKNRDKEMKRFYASSDWQQARMIQLAAYPICNRCKKTLANTVHHTTPAKTLAHNERLNPIHLESLCASCHTKHEKGNQGYEFVDLFN